MGKDKWQLTVETVIRMAAALMAVSLELNITLYIPTAGFDRCKAAVDKKWVSSIVEVVVEQVQRSSQNTQMETSWHRRK